MPDRGKTIARLKSLAAYIHSPEGVTMKGMSKAMLVLEIAARDAVELLKEQEPVEPVNVRWEMNIRGGTCPRCLNWVQRSYNYCPFCGRKVLWKDG